MRILIKLFVLTCFSILPSTACYADVITGTAFRISQGRFVTNFHIANPRRCAKLSINIGGTKVTQVNILDVEPVADLALLGFWEPSAWKSKENANQPKVRSARIKDAQSTQLGEPTFVYGFPLSGTLSNKGNFTTGVVSAVQGIANDQDFVQITNPIQRGNSGGPVLDSSGAVIGVVQSKLDAFKFAEFYGDLPQNVNFAVSNVALHRFIEKNKQIGTLDPSSFKGSQSKKLESSEIAREASEFTYQIECVEKDLIQMSMNTGAYEIASDIITVKRQVCLESVGYPISLTMCDKTLKFPVGGQDDAVNGESPNISYREEYSGDLVRGVRTGKGVLLLITPFGQIHAKYIGEFVKNNRSGKGQIIFSDGTYYLGEFKSGRPDGIGRYVYSNGSYYEGEFKDGKREGKGALYFYCGESGCVCGACLMDPTLKRLKYSKFSGQFINDSIEGNGFLSHSSGANYVGNWKNGELDGVGREIYPSGKVMYDGMWRSGRKVN